jgi:hypothetical protein
MERGLTHLTPKGDLGMAGIRATFVCVAPSRDGEGQPLAALRSLRFVAAYEPMTNVWSLKLDRYLLSPAKLAFKG